MLCPNCERRELATKDDLDRLVGLADDHERLWCPQCGHVIDRRLEVKAALEPLPVKKAGDVPRGTSRKQKAVRRLRGGRR